MATTATQHSRHHAIACVVLVVISALLSACASHSTNAITDTTATAPDTPPPAPRLRRDSVARITTTQAFGNLAVESSIDAPCGYRDDRTAVVCINVAGALNPSDVELIAARVRDGAAVQVHSEEARTALAAVADDLVRVTAARLVDDTSVCHGACDGRVEVTQPAQATLP